MNSFWSWGFLCILVVGFPVYFGRGIGLIGQGWSGVVGGGAGVVPAWCDSKTRFWRPRKSKFRNIFAATQNKARATLPWAPATPQ